MKVLSISSLNHTHNKIYQKNMTFTGYSELMHDAVSKSLKNDNEAENLFKTLFEAICKEKNTQIKNSFKLIKEIYDKSGFRGLLNELWKANPEKETAQLLNRCEYDCEDLILQNEKPILTLYNFGKYGFFGGKTKPYNTKIVFYSDDQKELIEFGLSKKGNLLTGQTKPFHTVDNEFYAETGTKKEELISDINGQHKTHYNKDGSEPFLKNYILDGEAPQVW